MSSSADVNRDIPASIPKLDSPDISYDIASYAHTLPRIVRILPEGGDRKVDVGTSGQEVRFKIPAGTYNFSRSVFRYSWATQADAALGQAVREDVLPIQQVILATQESGVELTKLVYADQYSRIANKAEVSFDKYITQDELDPVYPSNDLVANNVIGPIAEVASVNYLEYKYTKIAADTKTLTGSKAIELNAFKNTLLDLDKMIYYPEPLLLSIWFTGCGSWYQLRDDAKSDLKELAADGDKDVKVADLELFMKQESDPTIDAECKAAVLNAPADAPFTVYVPVVNGRRTTALSGSSAAYQVPLGSSNGVRLTKVYATPIPAPHAANTRYDSSNAGGVKVERYQTKFNSINVQPDAVDVKNNGDWYTVRDRLKGTAILNNAVYKRNWFILDDYSGITDETKALFPPGKHNLVTGKKIQLGDVFEIVADHPASVSVVWYLFFVGQRVLRIAPPGKGGIGYV